MEGSPLTLSECFYALMNLVLIVGPVVILERIGTWLGVWDVPDDINPSGQ